MKRFLILLFFIPIFCRAEIVNLKWNNPRNQSYFLTYGTTDSNVSFSRNVGITNKYSLDLKSGSYYIYVSNKDGQSNVIYYEIKNKTRNRKPPEIKLEIE
jgi:hypothetical protein